MNESLRMRAAKALLWMAGLALPVLAHAQDAAPDPADSGDTAWLLAASLLGLLLVLPGLALFHAGRSRAQSLVSVMTQTAAVVALVSVLWIVVGYTLAFGAVSNGWLGGGNAWMLIDLGNVRPGTFVPESAFALFEMIFALAAAALLAGAWVDRARFGWVIGFVALWSLIVYAPVAHWVWGGGWLATRLGTVDYAGGLVVHVSAGVSALVVALLLGRRERFAAALAHTGGSPLLTITGAALVWAGSLALAGGSAFAAGDDAAMALVNTHVAAAVAALAWLLLDRMRGAKAGPTGLARGMIAGLATVAPAAAYISPGMAMILGMVGAGLAKGAARLVQRHWQIDDSLGIFAGHGVTGAAGTMLTALVLHPAFGGTGYAPGMDLAHQLVGQALGLVAVCAWSAIATAIAALMVSMALPMRVARDDELAGLDQASHDEAAFQPD